MLQPFAIHSLDDLGARSRIWKRDDGTFGGIILGKKGSFC